MSNSPEVAMTVIEPGGRRWAQLLDINWPTRELIPLIVKRLDLPEQVDYDLSHVRSARVLKPADTLLSIGIVAGEELQLNPVRNKFLYDLLGKLYDEAVGYVASELWGQAESRLETILRLDPAYPDSKGVRLALDKRAGTTNHVAHPPGEPPAATPKAASTPPAPSTAYSPSKSTTGRPPAAPSTAQPAPVAQATKPRSACAVLALLIGGIVIVGLIVIAAGFAWFTLRSSESEGGRPIPTTEGEPVLGTGDVQITLRWDSPVDLDLHVTDPAGEEVWYLSPASASGGQLDVDANGTCSNDPPVENIFWPTGGAPGGDYEVSVVYYGSCDSTGAVNYEVVVLVDGRVVDTRTGTLTSEGETQVIGGYSR